MGSRVQRVNKMKMRSRVRKRRGTRECIKGDEKEMRGEGGVGERKREEEDV